MPTVDYDAARAEFARDVSKEDPFTFRLGGEEFTALREPMFGDIIELYETPEPDVSPDAAVFGMVRFIRRMLHPDDRQRFRMVLYTIPSTEATPVLIQLGSDMAEHFTAPFLGRPSESSPRRPRSSGARSRANGGGRRAS